MNTNNQFVRIIESDNEELKTKILCIEFPELADIDLLFIPKLSNIGFFLAENTVTIILKNPSFREQFNDWADRFIIKVQSSDNIQTVIEKFNLEIKALISFGQLEKKLSISSARGLYGELLSIKKMIDNDTMTHSLILEGWHRPAPANHDFDYEGFTLEVKTISRSNTTVSITSEDQLASFNGKKLTLNIYRIDSIQKSDEDSLGNLYSEIKAKLNEGVVNLFEMKCAEDCYCEYLGPTYMPLDYKFIVLEDSSYFVDQIEFPRVKKSELNNGISKVSYNVDISAISKFKLDLC
jgi:hypothetical protein